MKRTRLCSLLVKQVGTANIISAEFVKLSITHHTQQVAKARQCGSNRQQVVLVTLGHLLPPALKSIASYSTQNAMIRNNSGLPYLFQSLNQNTQTPAFSCGGLHQVLLHCLPCRHPFVSCYFALQTADVAQSGLSCCWRSIPVAAIFEQQPER